MGRGLRVLILAILAILIFERLDSIGWRNIASNLPRSFTFYLVFIFLYVSGPAIDALIYRHLWGVSWRELFPPMLRKRVLNESLLGYSGEAYLAAFANREFPDKDGVFFDIRDANIISAFASTATTLALVGIISLLPISSGRGFGFAAGSSIAFAAWAGFIILVATGAVAGQKFLRLRGSRLLVASGGYFVRIALFIILQIALWKAALPEAPTLTLLVILTAIMAATRIPFAPSYDVLLLGAGLKIAPVLGLPLDDVAGVLVASFALTQMLNLGVVTLSSLSSAKPHSSPGRALS